MTTDEITVYGYDGCDTCRKASAWLSSHGVRATKVPIVERPPSAPTLRRLIATSGLPARKWLNTSGQSYRAIGRVAVDAMSDDEIVDALAADGKLIKRPVLVTPRGVAVGFRPDAYEALTASTGGAK